MKITHLCFTLDSDWCIHDRAGGPEEHCDCLRAFVEAYGPDDGLDQYDASKEMLYPELCE